MTWQRATTIGLLLATAALLIVWDVVAQVTVPDSSATISRVVLGWVQAHPALPFAIGVGMGHLCWPQPNLKES